MSNYDITIHARDRQQVSFVCSEAEDLLSAADRESILLPSQCREGTCGACVATVTAGSYHLGEVSMEVLPEQVQARGEVLLCRTYPREDLILEAPYDYNYIRFERISEREAEVIDVMMVATGTRRLLLRLQPDEQGGAAEFEAGQFMEIQVPGSDARRAYSLANNTNWNGDLEFFITLRPRWIVHEHMCHDPFPRTCIRRHGADGRQVYPDHRPGAGRLCADHDGGYLQHQATGVSRSRSYAGGGLPVMRQIMEKQP